MDDSKVHEMQLLRAELERVKAERDFAANRSFCTWCGHAWTFKTSSERDTEAKAHAFKCESHPAHQFKQRAEAAEAEVKRVKEELAEARRMADSYRTSFDTGHYAMREAKKRADAAQAERDEAREIAATREQAMLKLGDELRAAESENTRLRAALEIAATDTSWEYVHKVAREALRKAGEE